MFPRSSTPPSGPRGSSPARRGMGRGGIQKRHGGPPRVDKDGDLVMDTVDGKARLGGDGNKGLRYRTGGRGAQIAGTSGGDLLTQRSQQAVIRGLELQRANVATPRISKHASAEHAESERKPWRHDPRTPIISLRVRGLRESKAASNPDGGLKDLLNFLERKANGQDLESHKIVRIKKSYLDGDSVIIKASPDDLARILKLNNFKFAGSTLSIETYQLSSSGSPSRGEEDMSDEARKTQEEIKSVLSARYDTNLKLLDLSRLGQDPGLVQMGMFDEKNRISKVFPVLMVVCDRLFSSPQEKQEAILSVTLAENDLDDISTVITLAQTFPDLQNLDISRNRISNLQALAGWKSKFRKLQILKVSENPIEIISPGYTEEIVKWFPTLQVLNEMNIRTPTEVSAAYVSDKHVNQYSKSDQACPIPINGPDFRDVNQIGESFLRQFFSLYDADRITLATNFYDESSTHSLSINISAPRSEEGSLSNPFPSAAFNNSRNLIKVKALRGQMSKIFRGVQAIKSFWTELPRTSHPDLSTYTAKYLVDCHPLAGLIDPTKQNPRGVDGLVLMVHGEYEEVESKVAQQQIRRSFSRTFVLGPGLPGGPVIRVVSDILVLRAWSPLISVSSEPNAKVQSQNLLLEPAQDIILRQLVFQTQMTPEYARLCLEETGWDLERAAIAFDANKSKLPVHAFMSQVQLP